MLPTVAPGQNYGSAPYRQLCPAYPSADRFPTNFSQDGSPRDRAKGSAGTFQRGKFPESCYNLNSTSPETHFSTALPRVGAELCGTSGTQQAWMKLAELNNYSKSIETSSTRLFASH
jgi:hypothetical protein